MASHTQLHTDVQMVRKRLPTLAYKPVNHECSCLSTSYIEDP